MTRRRPLPDAVVRRPVRRADALAAGVSGAELRGPLWHRLGRGVHAWAGHDPTDPDVRIAACDELFPPDVVIGGWAALRCHGIVELDGRTGPDGSRLLPVDVLVGPVARVRAQAGFLVDRSTLLPELVTAVAGRLVTTPARSCLDIARRYGVEEGLVAADLACRTGLTTAEQLRGSARALAGIRGVPAARTVAMLADGGARSVPESRLRAVWCLDARLPQPLVNPTVLCADGIVLGLPDLLDPDSGLVGEYDGAQHRVNEAHTADNAREEDFEACNLVVVRATSLDLWPHRTRLVHRLRQGWQRGQARDRSRDTWSLRPAS